jgi:hypothetical protein
VGADVVDVLARMFAAVLSYANFDEIVDGSR